MKIGIRQYNKVDISAAPFGVQIANSAALQTVGLTSNIAANEKQLFKAWVMFSVGATGGFKVAVIVPGSGNTANVTIKVVNVAGNAILTTAQLSEAPFGNALASAGLYWAEITGYIINGSVPGVIDIQCAQNSADALPLLIENGSYIEVIKG